jgi:transitional endoplasmic reticulum ATPase
MSTNHIDELKKAYEQSPNNNTILFILLDSLHQSGEYEQALGYLQKTTKEFDEPTHRVLAGTIALQASKPELALSYCSSRSPEELIIKAKAHLALFENEKGLQAYMQAIEQNPSLEFPELEKSLKAKVTKSTQASGVNVLQFRLLSNDEQTHSEPKEKDDTINWLKVESSDVTFKDVGGLENVKKQIHRKIVLPFQKPSLFQKFKKKSGGGVLLYGPPGCGKTLLARATAGECQAKFYTVAISDILDMWIGNSEKRLHAIFEQARRTAPAVLFFDELEALAGKRQFATDSAASRLVSQFLSEMDGFEQNNQGVLILGATNVPWSIDSAFRRPGRFDRIQFVPPPDRVAREVILKIIMSGRPSAANIDFSSLAKITSGFSGADLSYLIETACDLAIEESLEEGKEVPVSMNHLKEALKDLKPTTTEWLTTVHNYAKYSNESGQYDEVLDFFKRHGR